VYEFNDQNAPERYLTPVGFPYGAAHESEVQYLFSLSNTPFPGVLTAPQQQLAAAMKQYWTHLAKTGSPNSYSVPWWPRFQATSQQLLSLVPARPQVETGFAAEHHCAFWALAS
jgi:para-nitrobenzyl esterase